MAPSAEDYLFWVLDTRSIWEGNKIADAAPETLSLLSSDEQVKASKYHFLKDGKMSLASSLLKRFFVSSSAGVPWEAVSFTRLGDPVRGKPCYRADAGKEPVIDFNVSHQAGLVALAGCTAPNVLLGVDIVCVDERNNDKMIEREGFDSWVDMHAEVFSEGDVREMKQATTSNDQDTTKSKLRRFFAFWTLKEAYVKLEGEALLAPWLKDVEFRNVRCPQPAERMGGAKSETWGQTIADIEVWFRGEIVPDVEMTLQAFEENYMIATAIKSSSRLESLRPRYTLLDLDGIVKSNVVTVRQG